MQRHFKLTCWRLHRVNLVEKGHNVLQKRQLQRLEAAKSAKHPNLCFSQRLLLVESSSSEVLRISSMAFHFNKPLWVSEPCNHNSQELVQLSKEQTRQMLLNTFKREGMIPPNCILANGTFCRDKQLIGVVSTGGPKVNKTNNSIKI